MRSFLVLGGLCFGLAEIIQAAPQVTADMDPNRFHEKKVDTRALTFNEAVALMQQNSSKLAASEAGVKSSELQKEALKGLGGPQLLVTGRWGYHDLNLALPVSKLKAMEINLADNFLQNRIPTWIQPLLNHDKVPLGPAVEKMYIKGEDHFGAAILMWPIYTGGLVTSVKKLSVGRLHEEQANDAKTYAEEHRKLVERYFGAVLLREVAKIRREAVGVVAHHDYLAQRAMEEGVIAKVERLQATVALADAKKNALKAKNDSELAELALNKLLALEEEVVEKTPLFVHKEFLQSKEELIELALQEHPGEKRVKAKKQQAQALKTASTAAWKPTVSLVAIHELKRHKANKMVGVNVGWLLYSSVDRRKMAKAAEEKLRQAELSQQDADSDIKLLIEKDWRALENARETFFALDSNLKAAKEYMRLREKGLEQGVSTFTDLRDAQINLEKNQTERLKAALDYVIALNELVTSAGHPELFEKFLATSELKITQK